MGQQNSREKSRGCRGLKIEALPAAKGSGIYMGFWGKAEELTALCCLYRAHSVSGQEVE